MLEDLIFQDGITIWSLFHFVLQVESVQQVKKTYKKHERSQSAGLPVKAASMEIIKDVSGGEKKKSKKTLQETQDKLSSLKLTADPSQSAALSDSIEKTRKKKRRKRTQSADELNHDTDYITKDQTVSEANLVRANLYKNDKNKTFEKETKQSYSEASQWQRSVESTEGGERKSKTDNERREKRVKKKSPNSNSEVADAVETAISTDKVRRRLKKRASEKTRVVVEGDGLDGVDGTTKTRKEHRRKKGESVFQENLGFDDGEREADDGSERKSTKAKRRSRAKENLAYEDEQEKNQPDKETGTERKKTGKKRRRKLKETSADLIHRALEKKRQDDGHVLCIVIHKADRLKTDLRINHPVVRVHVVDMATGQYVKKCSRNRAATSYYENQETVDHILPVMTEPFDFRQRKSLIPSWEDVIIINEIYSYFLQRNEGDPKVIIFFEVLDFLSMTAIHKQKSSQRPDRGWYQIAWAFLQLVASNGSPNTDTKIRLQLFYPQKSYRRKPSLTPGVPEVYHWWCSSPRLPYPSTLYVTVKGIKPPRDLDAAGRSMFAVQEEKGRMTFEELTGKIARGRASPSESDGKQEGVAWVKLPGQPNRVPNQLLSTLQVGRRGCFVVRFSHDGRKLACGCADKDNFSIYVFETLTSRRCSKFQGHFSIIYDLCWSFDDKELLSASSDGTARSWNVTNGGTPAAKTYPHPCFVYAARYHPRRKSLVITGGYDCFVRIWSKDSDGKNGQLLREMDGHPGFINAICFDPSGQFMFSGDSTGTILRWNTFENRETKSKKKRSSTAGDVQRWVISKTVKDPEIKDCIINSVNLHPNGQKLLIHTRDNVTRMLDLRSFTVMNRYIGSNNFKEHVRSTLSTCGSFVFSGSEDGLVHVWNTETAELLKVYSNLGYTAAVSDIDFHPHDDIIVFCSFGENHPVLLYQFDQTGVNNEADVTRAVPPHSPQRLTSRTVGETTDSILRSDARNMERTATHMADVASETILLNKIKKKLDSVLEVSSTSADLRTDISGSRAFSPDRSARTPYGLSSETFQRGTDSWSTWGSDFSTLPTTGYDGQQATSRPSSRNTVLENSFMVRATYDFDGRSADELSLRVGDVIRVLRQEDKHWWVGEMMDGRQGFFPASYTALLEGTSKEQNRTGKPSKLRNKKEYTAVQTPEGEMKILSAPEDTDVDVMFTARSQVDGRPPRHKRRSRDITDGTRSLSPGKKRSPRRTKQESTA